MPRIKIGTRGSPLALIQARETRDRLIAAHGLDPSDIEIVSITTTGDRIKDRPLNEIGGKGLFTKEIEEALLAGEIQLAVHSMKDLPAILPDGLTIAAVLPREDPRDAFMSPVANSLAELKMGATIGSSSVRRTAQVLRLRPDLKTVQFRGNVETRLRKLVGRRGRCHLPRLRRAEPPGLRRQNYGRNSGGGHAARHRPGHHRH